MSEHENKDETSLATQPTEAEIARVEEAQRARATSEPGRKARSSPERRSLLCVASELLRAPGRQEDAQSLVELADYVDELEERCVFSGKNLPEHLQAEIDEEAAHADEIDSDYLESERPFGGLDVRAMAATMLAAIEPHAAAFRRFNGALTFREQAAIAIAAQLFRLDGQHDIPSGRVPRLAWHYADELEAARPAQGGAA